MASGGLVSPTPSTSSSCSPQILKIDWEVLEESVTIEEIENFIKYSIPSSRAKQTTNKINCTFCDENSNTHKMKRQYRKCNEIDECPVQYRVDSCSVINSGTIYMSKTKHFHELNEEYDNTNGIDEKIKQAILKILEYNPTKYPKKIRAQLNNEKEKFGITDLEVPPLSQIQGFVARQRSKIVQKSNKVEEAPQFIIEHVHFPTIDEDEPILTVCGKICVLVKDYSLAQTYNSFPLVASRNNKFIEASKTCQAQDFVLYNNNPNTL